MVKATDRLDEGPLRWLMGRSTDIFMDDPDHHRIWGKPRGGLLPYVRGGRHLPRIKYADRSLDFIVADEQWARQDERQLIIAKLRSRGEYAAAEAVAHIG